MSFERSYGGDSGGLGTGDLCGLSLNSASADSAMAHTYSFGTLETSEYLETNGSGVGFLSVDQDIDPSTGLVSTGRDVAGVGTDFQYDLLGRATRATPRDSAYQVIAYGAPANGETRVTSTLHDPGTHAELARSATVFDSFGRPSRESVRFPDGVDRERDTEYNALNWILSRSEQGDATARTVFSDFDAFGRARTLTRPDGSQATFVYSGVRQMERTVFIEQAGGVQPSTTTEVYDRQGRLERVIEPSRPDGSNATTTYDYDVGNRLVQVNSGAQTRLFTYDGRGFLLAEQHPEKGAAGNGTVSYAQYDARGLAGQVIDLVPLTYSYDRAARLTEVREGGNAWKRFAYATSNSANDGDALGKVLRATRFNRSAWNGGGAQVVEVEESYRYKGLDGVVSDRDTRVRSGAQTLALFHQSWTRTPLGNPANIIYPCLASEGTSGLQCLSTGDPAPARTVQHGYINGFLTSVGDNLGSWADSISYHPNGLIDRVDFPNGQSYFQTRDPDSMSRPASIGANIGGATVELSFDYDPAGNVTRMGNATGNQDYFYDPVSRLKEMRITNGRYQSYSYDRQGNITHIETVQGNPPVLENRSLPTNAATNHLNGVTYDNAGNVRSWNSASYVFDPLGQMSDQSGGSRTQAYLYTADEERIAARTFADGTFDTRWVLRDLGGEVLREYRERPTGSADLYHADGFETDDLCAWWWANGSTTGVPTCRGPGFVWSRDDVYRGSAHLGADGPEAGVPKSGRLFHFPDHLGTPRIITNQAGEVVGGELTWAFGEQLATTPLDGLPIPKRFTGHERDTNAPGLADDLDYMHARYCSPHLGRFISADRVGGNYRLPQSWNRYAYVLNNPLKYVDPSGLTSCSRVPGFEDVQIDDCITVTSIGEESSNLEMFDRFVEYAREYIPSLKKSLIEIGRETFPRPPNQVSMIIEDETDRRAREAIDLAMGVAAVAAVLATVERRNPAQDQRLSAGEIKAMKRGGVDPEELKGGKKTGRFDHFKDKEGNIYIKPKDGSGPGEPTGFNINDFKKR